MTAEEAINFFEQEIAFCREAPALNGCEMQEEWRRTIDACELAVSALRAQQEELENG